MMRALGAEWGPGVGLGGQGRNSPALCAQEGLGDRPRIRVRQVRCLPQVQHVKRTLQTQRSAEITFPKVKMNAEEP